MVEPNDGRKVKRFLVGAQVMARDYRARKSQWIEVRITRILGK